MRRIALFAYGILVYAFFFISLRYFLFFVENVWVLRRLDFGETVPLPEALGRDVGLLLLFGLHHSLMARPRLKRLLTRVIPAEVERSTYVLVATLMLLLLVFEWRPITASLWTLTGWPAGALIALSYGGWLLAAWGSWQTDHFELFGVQQVYCLLRSRPPPNVPFTETGPYRFVRHPMNLGFLIAIWSTPTMTVGHLLFAVSMTIYVRIGIAFEERELQQRFGDVYAQYRARVPMLLGIPHPAR